MLWVVVEGEGGVRGGRGGESEGGGEETLFAKFVAFLHDLDHRLPNVCVRAHARGCVRARGSVGS